MNPLTDFCGLIYYDGYGFVSEESQNFELSDN
jgi:hypothetical protein